MSDPTISAYIQCHANKGAVYQALTAFRTFYADEDVTLVSDRGEDFSKFGEHFRLRYYYSGRRADPRHFDDGGAAEYLRRIYDHCQSTASDYVVILEDDVTTRRRIRQFPATDCGGPRFNALSPALNAYLRTLHNSDRDYGYAMCGGSIFRRRAYLDGYDRQNLDLAFLKTLDEAVVTYSDVTLTILFLINGYSYSVWSEVSEMHHPIEAMRIFRDSAFDHADKRW